MTVQDLIVSDRTVVAEAMAASIESQHAGDPILSALALQLRAVSEAYSTSQATYDAASQSWKTVDEQVAQADEAADRSTSTMWFVCSGQRQYELRDFLFPSGIGFTRGSTAVEVGILRRLIERAKPGPGVPQLDAVRAQLDALPAQLDAVEQALSAQRSAYTELRASERALREARAAYDRVLSHSLRGIAFALAGSEHQAARQELLRPYEEAVQRAKARRKKSDEHTS